MPDEIVVSQEDLERVLNGFQSRWKSDRDAYDRLRSALAGHDSKIESNYHGDFLGDDLSGEHSCHADCACREGK